MKQIAFTWLLCILSICAYAQQITVTGTVTDAENNPLIGAAVVVVGTTDGVITDFDGKYTIKAASGQSLNFSYVGYREQTVKVDGRSVINVKLSEGELLDEVVVIGYGTVKKSHLTGAVASVSGKELQANVARSASAALQGRVAGVTVSAANGQPGEGLNINVRGISSLSATSPLYVIDGVYGDINMVDPADIQSIEVLKDASAAAIYGSRAANGVVLVTTKGGRLETPARVTVDAYTGVQMVAKYIDVMDGNQLRDLAKATGYSSAEGLLNWNGGAGTDWQKELYNSAMVSKVSLNVSGGNKTSTYNLSGSYLNQDGIVNTTGYEAWNIRAKNTFSFFNNHLRMGTTLMMKSTVNAGTVENKGFEISLNHRNNVGDLYYHVGVNATFIKNELTEVNGSRDEWQGFNPHAKGTITYAKTGHSIGYFNLIKTDGVFQSQQEIDAYVDKNGNKIQPNAQPGDLRFVDYNGDGKIDNNDRQDVGSAFPKVNLGVSLGAEWKGLDLNMFFDGNFGNKIYNAQYYSTVYNESTGNQYAERMNSWTENNHSDIPRCLFGTSDPNGTNWGYTDRWLENGSFLRLKTLELGYTLPKVWVSKAGLQNVRVYTAMENLFTITDYKGYTPDLGMVDADGAGTSGGSGVMTRGCDDGRYPMARTITFGLQVNF